MDFLLTSYILVPIALAVMFRNYKPTNWLWAGFLIVSIFCGIAPFVAIAYLITFFFSTKPFDKNNKNTRVKGVTYHPDGSYTVYSSQATKSAPSTGKVAFRVIGGILAGLTMAFGLLLVGIVLLITIFPNLLCPGNSKGC
jgi:hypothetical protein